MRALLLILLLLPFAADARLVYEVHFDGPVGEDPRGGDCRQLHHITDSLPRCEDLPPCLEEDPADCPPRPDCTRHDRAAYHTTWDVASCGETAAPNPSRTGYADFKCTGDGVIDYIAKFDLDDVWVTLDFYGDPSARMAEQTFLELHSSGGSAMNCNDPVPGLVWSPDLTSRIQFDVTTCGDLKLPPEPTLQDRLDYEAALPTYRKRLTRLATERPERAQWHSLLWHFNPQNGDSELWVPGADWAQTCRNEPLCLSVSGRPARSQTPNTVQGFLLRDVAGCDAMRIDNLRFYDAKP